MLLPLNKVFQGRPYPLPRAATCFGNVKLRFQRRSDKGLQRGTRPRIANDRTGSTEEMEDYRGVLNVRLLLPVALPERNLAERLKAGRNR